MNLMSVALPYSAVCLVPACLWASVYRFWLTFCVVGQPLTVLLYYHDFLYEVRVTECEGCDMMYEVRVHSQ
jgi:hypothetical protein